MLKIIRLSLLLFLVLTSLGLPGPLSERILFVAEHNGLKKLYICRPDGRDLRRFCKEPGFQLQPCYSPELERVFFVRPVKQLSQICSVDNEGRDFRVETDILANARYPSVSPDGKTLLFSTDLWGAFELAQMDLESKELERLTYDASINTRGRYSPDGSQILFLTRRTGSTELFTLALSNKALHRLTESPFPHGAGSWNPEGTRFVATVAKPPNFKRVLIEKDLETDTLRFLLTERLGIKSPCYSQDGSQILFIDDEVLYTYDPSDTKAVLFPLKGNLVPEEVIWIPFPLP
jgi:TolB protein